MTTAERPTAVVDWYPLLRKLHAAGWEHSRAFGTGTQHVWERNRYAVNQQRISADGQFHDVSIGGVVMSAAGLNPGEADMFLSLLGAFEPTPKRVERPLTPLQLQARQALLTRAANDPEVDDDTFAVISCVVEGRPL